MSRGRSEILSRPEQGWSSLLLLLGMLVLLAVSVADSRPFVVTERGSLTDTLPIITLAAGLIGYLLARSPLGVVRAHTIGAAVAAFVLLFVAGAWLAGESPLPTSLDGVGARIDAVWLALMEDLSGETTTYLVMGAICWTTAQFAAFGVFRYDRGGPAVMAVGTLLFLNVGLGTFEAEEELLPVVPVLAAFAALALLLLMRLQLVQQRYAWARRHISDTRDVSRLFLRTGTAFVLIAVLSASSLTVWATVEAQEISIDGIEEPLQDLADEISEMLGFFGVPTGEDVPPPLGTRTPLSTTWNPGTGIAFTADIEEGRLYGNYWWGKADDRYDYRAGQWVTTTEAERPMVEAGDQLWSADEARTGGTYRLGVRLEVGDGSPAQANLYRPPDVYQIDSHEVRARFTDGGGISDIEFPDLLDPADEVRFLSWVHDYEGGPDSLTASELRAAGTDYPEWVSAVYLDGAEDRAIVGPRTRAMADRIRGEHSTPYEQALAVQDELRQMRYEEDLDDQCQGFEAFPECLLTIEEGFCQQFATTMVMVMRAMDVPARYVTGYLPGTLDETGRWEVEKQALHNWVEVYFPGYGWIRFDPTPGLADFSQVPTDLLEGETPDSDSTPSPDPLATEEPLPTESPEEALPPEELPSDGAGGGDATTGILISLAGLAALLTGVVSVLLLYRLRRLPEGDDSLAYRGIVSLATRLGYGPHPSQTEYEYAGTLSDAIPTVRDDLFVVTDAQVQTTYGARDLDDARRGLLRGAYARIRTALLRLSLRRRR